MYVLFCLCVRGLSGVGGVSGEGAGGGALPALPKQAHGADGARKSAARPHKRAAGVRAGGAPHRSNMSPVQTGSSQAQLSSDAPAATASVIAGLVKAPPLAVRTPARSTRLQKVVSPK